MGYGWKISKNMRKTAKEAKTQTWLLWQMKQAALDPRFLPRDSAPAGWYGDPYGSPVLRWWDGQQWTEHTHEAPLPR